MHPVLARKAWIAAYLLAWLPPGALLAGVLVQSGELGWGETTTLVAPLILVYAFACLSSWYLCHIFPPRTSAIAAMLLAHGAAAAASSGLWVGLAVALAAAYTRLPGMEGLDERLAPRLPVLFATGVLLALLITAFHYVVLAVEGSREAESREMKARLLAGEAELRALKAQVNPHFLFNSLHSISALTSMDPAQARDMCVRLADFLRSTLGLSEKGHVPLSEELALARGYLAVERVRFGSRLQLEEAIEPGCAACLVPALVLQPLVENAVKHGIASLLAGGRIRLEARRSAAQLLLAVENDFDPEQPPRAGGGLGLENVRRRLGARYGAEARLEAGARAAGRYRVELLLPAETERPA